MHYVTTTPSVIKRRLKEKLVGLVDGHVDAWAAGNYFVLNCHARVSFHNFSSQYGNTNIETSPMFFCVLLLVEFIDLKQYLQLVSYYCRPK